MSMFTVFAPSVTDIIGVPFGVMRSNDSTLATMDDDDDDVLDGDRKHSLVLCELDMTCCVIWPV